MSTLQCFAVVVPMHLHYCHYHCHHCCLSALIAVIPASSSSCHPCCWDFMQLHLCQLGCQESAPGGPTLAHPLMDQCVVHQHVSPLGVSNTPSIHLFSSTLCDATFSPAHPFHCTLSTFCIWLGSPYCIFVRGALLPCVWLHSPPHFFA